MKNLLTNLWICFCFLLLVVALIAPTAQGLPIDETTTNNDSFSAAEKINLASSPIIRGNIFPIGDLDFYSFNAQAGDTLFAATQTRGSVTGNGDTTLTVLDSDGVSVLEQDLNDGSFSTSASSISGLTLSNAGTYYILVTANAQTTSIRPYYLHLNLTSATTSAEIEPNQNILSANALSGSMHVSGNLSSAADVDYFKLPVVAGSTIFVSLDLDPERDTTEFAGKLLFNYPNQFAEQTVNNSGALTPDSEALFLSPKESGDFIVGVASNDATFGSYRLKIIVTEPEVNSDCVTTSSDTAQSIPSQTMTASNLLISNAPRVGKLSVNLNLDHNFMQDLDVSLVSPEGNEVVLFSDIGASVTGNRRMDISLSDDAALPIHALTAQESLVYTPEQSLLSFFEGMNPNGTWTLKIHDDAANDDGILNSWSITVCPQTEPTCLGGSAPVEIFSTDFESDDSGFTHSGVLDEWERGLPSSAPLASCNSGSNCWKTDLDAKYNNSSNQSLDSPNISLDGFVAPYYLRWAHKYSLESASFDQYKVVAEDPTNPSNTTQLFEHLAATMNTSVGNPSTIIQQSAGWGLIMREIKNLDASEFKIKYALTSDSTVDYAGIAIDDFTLIGCRADKDLDGSADSEDQCDDDATKTLEGICGCGTLEVDSDTNGITDCLVNQEINLRLDNLKAKLKKVKAPKNKKQKAKQKAIKLEVKTQLNDVQNYLTTNGSKIILATGSEIGALSTTLLKSVKKALKTNSPNFKKNKRKGIKSITDLRSKVL